RKMALAMVEKKQIIYFLVLVFVGIIGFQIYMTTTEAGNNSNNNNNNGGGLINTNSNSMRTLDQLLEIQKQQQETLKELSARIAHLSQNNGQPNQPHQPEQPHQPHNGKSGVLRKKEFLSKEDHANITAQIEARRKSTTQKIPNTCMPITEGKQVCLPNFIVIGSMKAGTTFLDFYIQTHPLVAKHTKKEIWYFNSFYYKGIQFYGDHFEPAIAGGSKEQSKLIGEATPFYVNNPFTAQRIFSTLRSVKLILMLRDPVDRALSQYHFSLKWMEDNRNRNEAATLVKPLSFDDMVREEIDVIDTCVRGQERYKAALDEWKLTAGPDDSFDLENPYFQLHNDKNWTFYAECKKCDKCFQTGNMLHASGHPTFGMLAKSLYYDQLEHWLNYFPLDQIHIVRYEDIANQPEKVMSDVELFLGLPEYDYGEFRPKNVVPHGPMNNDTRAMLVEYFRPQNEKLYKLLNRDFGWA
ncbi:hypothetical protein SAMD00019534_028420, partial [Acytostelium subglobosum LB1]|uniref:hypothetical protein n=1 Tax=Acytostelium subglobosum LB1 TaxID=1410327 RepID=UPI000644938E